MMMRHVLDFCQIEREIKECQIIGKIAQMGNNVELRNSFLNSLILIKNVKD